MVTCSGGRGVAANKFDSEFEPGRGYNSKSCWKTQALLSQWLQCVHMATGRHGLHGCVWTVINHGDAMPHRLLGTGQACFESVQEVLSSSQPQQGLGQVPLLLCHDLKALKRSLLWAAKCFIRLDGYRLRWRCCATFECACSHKESLTSIMTLPLD